MTTLREKALSAYRDYEETRNAKTAEQERQRAAAATRLLRERFNVEATPGPELGTVHVDDIVFYATNSDVLMMLRPCPTCGKYWQSADVNTLLELGFALDGGKDKPAKCPRLNCQPDPPIPGVSA